MKGQAFNRWLEHETKRQSPAHAEYDPSVEMYDGAVRVFDQLGESCSLKLPLPRQLRQLALQLTLCAEEIERRGFESTQDE